MARVSDHEPVWLRESLLSLAQTMGDPETPHAKGDPADETSEEASRLTCDVCDAAIPHDDHEEYSVAGCGVFISCRGDEVRREDVPLCPRCASAIGMSALGRWEIEEDEG